MARLNYGLSINLFHIFIVAPIMAYAGYYGAESNPQIFTALLALGVLAALYHAYRLYEVKQNVGINLFHIFIVAPLFIYVGYMGTKAMPQLFTVLMFLSIVVLLYHLYRAYQNYQVSE